MSSSNKAATGDPPAGEQPTISFQRGGAADESFPETMVEASATGSSPSGPAVTFQFGEYEILGEIARGGMGVVYKARQKQLNRTIALKMIRSGNLASPADIKRFHTEAEAAAALDHSGIVPIYESGERSGQHFYAMAYIDGQSLHARLKNGPLPPREAAELVMKVSEAVGYAHAKGIIHRDLKPHNILLDASGQPKVTDFGLAKRLDNADGMTCTGEVLGTPSYMAPEQAQGKAAAAGPLADVYALGAILYATLTGRPPFQAATLAETLRQVIEREPVAPQLLNPATPRDLQTICLKCLQKEPERRYTSAAELSADLGRWLTGEPIRARPVSATEQVLKWIVRRPVAAAAIGLGALAVVLSAIGITVSIFWQNAEQARARAESARGEADQARAAAIVARNQEKDARQRMETALQGEQQARAAEAVARRELEETKAWNQYVLNVRLAPSFWEKGWVHNARQALEDCPPALRQWEWHYLHKQMHPELAVLAGHANRVLDLQISPNGKWLATCRDSLRVWNPETGQELARLSDRDLFRALAFHPNGTQVAAGNDGGFGVHRPGFENVIVVWNLERQQEAATLHLSAGVISIAYSNDGTRLIAGLRNGELRIWDTADMKPIPASGRHTNGIVQLVPLPDGTLVTGCWNRAIKFWDLRTGQERTTGGNTSGVVTGVAGNVGNIMTLVAGLDGSRVTSFATDGTVKSWDVANRCEVATFQLGSEVLWVSQSPDGRCLTVTSPEHRQVRTLKILDAQSLHVMRELSGHRTAVRAAVFGPDALSLASASLDGEIRLWNTSSGELLSVLQGHISPVSSLKFNRQGTRLYSSDADGQTRIWDLTRQPDASPLTEPMTTELIALDGAGRRAAYVARDGALRVRNLATGEDQSNWGGPSSATTRLALAPDGKHLVSAHRDTSLRLWKVEGGAAPISLTGHTGGIQHLAFSPQGDRFASAGDDRTIRIWSVADARELATLRGHQHAVMTAAFSPDGSRVASVSRDNTFRLWDTASGAELSRSLWEFAFTPPTNSPKFMVRFSRDGRRVASCNFNILKVWDTVTGREIAKLTAPTKLTTWEFSPSGNELVYAGLFLPAFVWDFTQQRVVAQFPANAEFDLQFTPDGSRLAGACSDRSIRIWDTATWQELATFTGHDNPAFRLLFEPGGKLLVSASFDGTVRRWVAAETPRERDARLRDRPRIWRLEHLQRAEEVQNWYAIVFHLGWLLQDQPDDPMLTSRFAEALAQLQQNGLVAPTFEKN